VIRSVWMSGAWVTANEKTLLAGVYERSGL
jgi:hypothetical protein